MIEKITIAIRLFFQNDHTKL